MELPPGWALAAVSELIGAGGLFVDGDWVESKDQDPSGDIRLTQLADVGDGEWRNRSDRHMTAETAERLRCTELKAGDVLVARMPDPLGRACRFPGDTKRCVTVVDVAVIRPGPRGVKADWLMWSINSPLVRTRIEALQAGTTRKRISRKNLGGIEIAVPPVVEQERIVAAIEEAFSKLDAGEQALLRARRLAALLRKSVLLAAVPASIPTGWAMTTIGEAGRVQLGRQRHPDWHNGPNMRPYLRVANVFEGRIDTTDVDEMHFDEDVFDRYRLQNGDILLNEGNTPNMVGRAAMYEGDPSESAFTKSLIRFQAGDGVDPAWALLVFRRHLHAGRFMREARITTNISHLPVIRLKPIEFPVPPLSEQLRIVDEVESQMSFVSACARDIATGLIKSTALRRSVLKTAFDGKLVPQVPSDEPASLLLERIRNERPESEPAALARSRRKKTEAL